MKIKIKQNHVIIHFMTLDISEKSGNNLKKCPVSNCPLQGPINQNMRGEHVRFLLQRDKSSFCLMCLKLAVNAYVITIPSPVYV